MEGTESSSSDSSSSKDEELPELTWEQKMGLKKSEIPDGWNPRTSLHPKERPPPPYFDIGIPRRDDPDWVYEWLEDATNPEWTDIIDRHDQWHFVNLDGTPLEEDYAHLPGDDEPVEIPRRVLNGMLSSDACREIYQKWKDNPKKNTPEALAEEYNIGFKRCYGIIRLWEVEDKWMSGEIELPGLDRVLAPKIEKFYDGKHHRIMPHGLDPERHRRIFPTAPMFIFGTKEELEKPLTEDNQPIETDEEIILREEKLINRQFVEKVDYNIGIVGGGLIRNQRRTRNGPVKPPGGHDILVQPLHGKRGGFAKKRKHQKDKIRRIGVYKGPFLEGEEEKKQRMRAYVSKPDGTQRTLDSNEVAFYKRRKQGIILRNREGHFGEVMGK